MIDKDKLEKLEWFYKKRVRAWMIADIKRSIAVGTNFLTALGCFTYTEVIGILLPPIPGEKGSKEERRFYRCFFRLPSGDYLKKFDKWLKDTTKRNVYQNFRHNMVHKYFPAVSIRKKDGIVLFAPLVVARSGFVFDKSTGTRKKSFPFMVDKEGRITLAIKNYITELEKAAGFFYDSTLIKKNRAFQEAAAEGIDVLLKGKEGTRQ